MKNPLDVCAECRCPYERKNGHVEMNGENFCSGICARGYGTREKYRWEIVEHVLHSSDTDESSDVLAKRIIAALDEAQS